MSEPTPQLLTEVLSSVLEEAAFFMIEPEAVPAAYDVDVFSATIDFEAVRGGQLRLTASRNLARNLAANMLGIDPNDPEADEQGRNALGEILNVLGGAFITRHFGTKVPFQLGLPAVSDEAPVDRRATCAAAVRVDTGDLVVLELDLEPGR
ncbi:MAG: chemotaxis protein CheX [Anaeromyxobacteraceae bacterium]